MGRSVVFGFSYYYFNIYQDKRNKVSSELGMCSQVVKISCSNHICTVKKICT